MYFDDSDKTVADFDIEAFNRQYEAKKKAEDSEVDDSDESFEDDFEDFEDDLFKDDDLEEELEHSIGSKPAETKTEATSEEAPKSDRSSRRKREQAPAEKTEIFDLNTFNMGQEEAAPASEKTEIFDLNKFNMGGDAEEEEIDYARIKILEGADPVEYTLTTDSFTVGRSDDNDITISNGTISRTHCEFSYIEGEGFTVKDLNSGNGIKVNGRKTTEKKIKSGDKISIGGIKVQFFDLISEEGDYDEPRQVKRPSNPKNKKMILIAVAGFLILGVVAGVVISKKNKAAAKRAQILAEKQRQEQLNAQAMNSFERGIKAYKNKEWNAAIEYFNAALEIRPEFTDAKTNKEAALKEKGYEASINTSKDDLIAKNYQGALLKLKKIPETSIYYGEAQKNYKQAMDLYLTARLVEAQQKFDAQEFSESKVIVDGILTKNPTHEKAMALQKLVDEKLIEQKKKEEKCPKKGYVRNDEGKCVRETVKRRCPRGQRFIKGRCRTYTPPPRDPAEKLINTYNAGNLDAIIKKMEGLIALKSEKAPLYAKQLKELKKRYALGMRAAKQRNVNAGIPMLRKALNVDAQLRGKLAPDIKKALANLHGIRAEKYFAQKVYENAYANVSKALRYDKNEPLSQKVLASLKKTAKDLYIKAYMKEARDPAAAKKTYKRILKMVPSNATAYQKAKGRL